MKVKSAIYGEWPQGTHWTPGEVREIAGSSADLPDWLEPVAAKKGKAKAKKAEQDAQPEG